MMHRQKVWHNPPASKPRYCCCNEPNSTYLRYVHTIQGGVSDGLKKANYVRRFSTDFFTDTETDKAADKEAISALA
jgi:hypothetical protein